MAKQNNQGGFSLKDELFNRDRVEFLAGRFQTADESFDSKGFIRKAMKRLGQLELKERIVHLAETLEEFLSPDYRIAAKQIVDSLPPPLDGSKSDNDFGDFIFAPLGEFVVRNGLERKHLKRSLATLKQLTQRFSMEDAIRAFINEHPEPTLRELDRWSAHRHYHVRRLVSEGTRPRLPWSKRLSIDVTAPLPLLEKLHADPTRYVTRSVANHLNDLAKTHPDVVIETLSHWKALDRQNAKELQWMSRHALRTLVKQGNADALKFLGFRPDPRIEIRRFELAEKRIRPGDAIELTIELTAKRDESLVVDYVIHFVKANGELSPKVHKLKQLHVERGEHIRLHKRHKLRADATTYKLYPGKHSVTLQINGKAYGKQAFDLT